MYIESSGDVDLSSSLGPDSTYRKDPRAREWEALMDSYFVGGGWTLMSEIHSSDVEWNKSLGLRPAIPASVEFPASASAPLALELALGLSEASVPAALDCVGEAVTARSAANRRFMFSCQVKAECLADYKDKHDNIWVEVAGGLRAAGVHRLTTWQLPGTNRLGMLIETAGALALDKVCGTESAYQQDPVARQWEALMNSYFEGGSWTQMGEIHASDVEWNSSLDLL